MSWRAETWARKVLRRRLKLIEQQPNQTPVQDLPDRFSFLEAPHGDATRHAAFLR